MTATLSDDMHYTSRQQPVLRQQR